MPPDLTIRQARRDDLSEIVALLADDVLGAAREDAALAGPYVEAFEAIAAEPNTSLVVAESGGRVVATMQIFFLPHISRRGGWRAQLESVHVASGLRGRGIGAALLAYAVARARERGCVLVQLTTDKRRAEARRFYERLGFRATHEGMKLALGEGEA